MRIEPTWPVLDDPTGEVVVCRCSDADARRAHVAFAEDQLARNGITVQPFEWLMGKGGFCVGEMDRYAPGWVRRWFRWSLAP